METKMCSVSKRPSEHFRWPLAADELGMTQQQLNDYVNARPSIFKLENAKDNLSHRYEKPGIDDLEDIRDDMEKFLTTGK